MIRWIAIGFFASTLGAQNADFISAMLDASVTPTGALRGQVFVMANGPASLPYRDTSLFYSREFPKNLYGSFFLGRRFSSIPIMTGADNPAWPVVIEIPIQEPDYLPPIQRQLQLKFDLLPDSVRPASRRESIVFQIPPNFALEATGHIDEDRAFAHYRSSAAVESGKLVIERELELREPGHDADPFWNIVRSDRERAFVLRRVGRTDASAWVESVPPDRAMALGIRAYDQHEYQAARQLFEKAVKASPLDRFAWNRLGLALAALGKLEEAERAYQKSIDIYPSDAYAYNNLGLVLERQGKWREAVENLKKQLEIRPADRYAILNLPRALIHESRWAEAEQAALKATQADPANTQQRANLAIARICQGSTSSARQDLEAVLGPRAGAGLLNNAAFYLTECGKEPALAESYARRALDQVDRSRANAMRNISSAIAFQTAQSTYLDTYGWVLFKKGDATRAVAYLDAAAALSPRAEVYAHLAQAETQLGRTEPALAHWREATFLEPVWLQKVPAQMAAKVQAIAPKSVERGWYPIEANLPTDALRPQQSCYFFVVVNPDGTIQSARALDDDDPASKQLTPGIRALGFPVIRVEGTAVPAVYIVQAVKGNDGRVQLSQSVSTEAVAIASDLAPGEFPLAAPATPAGASSNTPAVLSTAPGVTPPRVVSKVEPQYSEEARQAHLVGMVALKGVVGTDGKARELQTTRGLGLGLDESAIAAVSAWRFQPGTKDGQPANVFVTVELNFRLLDGDSPAANWHLTRAEFRPPQNASRPLVEKTKAPHMTSPDGSRATVTFEIDEKGLPKDVQVEKASDNDWARAVVSALREWRFTPGQKDGRPIPVPCAMEFVRGN